MPAETTPDHTTTMDPVPLPLTGERTAPGIPDERYWFERHVVAYGFAATRLAARRTAVDAPIVLDAGCGEGYGLALLADAGAARVVGVDYDAATIAHARATYAEPDPRITVVQAELLTIPLPDAAVDLTVSFQVIEHLYDVPGYLRSLARVTRPGGEILIATPNRLTFTPDSDTPVNPFHVREFTAAELVDELAAAGLEVVEVVGLHHGTGLLAAERELGARLTDLLTADPANWSDRLRAVVHGVDADAFDVRSDAIDTSLDLLARCRVVDPSHDQHLRDQHLRDRHLRGRHVRAEPVRDEPVRDEPVHDEHTP